MTALYPNDLDKYREWLKDFDYMTAQDMNDLFEGAFVIQQELGTEPSGEHGTMSSRMFDRGSMSETAAAWNKLRWSNQAIPETSIFNRDATQGGFKVNYGDSVFAGHTSAFGEGVPTPFGALQSPLNSGFGANNRGKVPWRAYVANAESDFSEWVAADGQNVNLSGSNTDSCVWGYLVWNLVT